MSVDWDAVVVGAGPAGSLAARQLARRGLSVLLAERKSFPRPKVCGGCLNAKGLATLNGAGLGALPAGLAAPPLHSLLLTAGGRGARLALNGGAAVERGSFDAALAREAIAAGAVFLDGCQVLAGPVEATMRRLVLRTAAGEKALGARVVIAADGLGGGMLPGRARPVRASRLGAGAVLVADERHCGSGLVKMAVGRSGYLGLVRLGDGRLNAAAALDASAVRAAGGLGAAAALVLAEAGHAPVPGLAEAVWTGTPQLTRRPHVPAAERLFAIGDASGYVEPFTGEGMAWALEDAVAVADFAAEAVSGWTPSLVPRWSARHRSRTRSSRWRCRAIALTLRSPAACAWLVRGLGARPTLGRALAATIHGVGADR